MVTVDGRGGTDEGSKPMISVIVLVYNSEIYLSPCLNSLLQQSLSNIEILCIYDHSEDDSLGVLEQYAGQDPRIKITIRGVNDGVSGARNLGLSLARGEYVTFVDSDDFCDIDFCKRLWESAERNHADLVICDFVSFQSPKDILRRGSRP